MPLHIEAIADALLATVRGVLPARLGVVLAESDGVSPLPAPTEWFLGAPARIRTFRCPAGFVRLLPVQSSGSAGLAWGAILHQKFRAQVSIVHEAQDEERLTLAGYRYASALDETLHNRDITVHTNWTTRVWVTRFDYAPAMVGRGTRIFRKAIALSMTIAHWDLFTPVP